MDHTEIVKGIIDKKNKDSNGSCGISIPDMALQSQLSNEELNPILKQLYSEKYFILREGINGKLIFKK